MLEKQWNLSTEAAVATYRIRESTHKKIQVTGSGTSACRRRTDTRRKVLSPNSSMMRLGSTSKQLRSIISPELLQNRLKGYVKGVISEDLLIYSEVVHLSKIIKSGLYLEEQKLSLGHEPSEEQLATSLKISCAELQLKLIECALAREKLAMSNVHLVMSIAQRYDNMACLNMSQKKVRNATEAINKVISLDKEAFPSLNGLLGETLHSYIADNHLENNPWHGVDEWTLKVVKQQKNLQLRERESDIILLYYGLDNECLTWEDISKRIGLSRERVRQVGLLALQKLKHAARKRRLEAMLVKH
ncbi:RNA polymerase sigma factor sigA [Camellia lanceoleosa]|uniref:RNA polymerase sigma factor sigA n=1 Tax=Camellia lanceoleosa TaxID=1840588 RepID=A0ACC0HZJ6_9ERIC|nr:RNA polymerase sigma factor sigA [Camellia lanceoleosa]